jgi:glutaredoxin/glutathione-dependent peroxiredoxin
MTIQVGDRLPQATFRVMTPEGPAPRTTDDIFKGRKVVLVAVPGAFTPTCHHKHLPGYVEKAKEIKDKGVDAIAVTSVNDVWVLDAWAKSTGAEGIEFLADGNGEFANAIGLAVDSTASGLGTRSRRYAMVVEDGVVQALNVEEARGKAETSGAENLLRGL